MLAVEHRCYKHQISGEMVVRSGEMAVRTHRSAGEMVDMSDRHVGIQSESMCEGLGMPRGDARREDAWRASKSRIFTSWMRER